MALCEQDLDAACASPRVLINAHTSPRPAYLRKCRAHGYVKAAGGRVVFDVDIGPCSGDWPPRSGRKPLCSKRSGYTTAANCVALCDLIVGTEEEIRILAALSIRCP